MSAPAGTPVWAARPLEERPRPLPARVDVAVIGGGIAGVAALRALTRRGLVAVLLERDHLAAGASGRNAGFLLAGVADNYAVAARRYGRGVAREVWEFTVASHAMIRGGVAGADGAAYERHGSWTLATTAAERDELEESATLLAEDGVDVEWHAQPEGVALAALGGLRNPGDGAVDPAATVRALAGDAVDSVHEHAEVRSIEPSAHGVRLQSLRGEVTAAAVVVATNAWAPQLVAGVPITPVRGQLLATAPGSEPALLPTYAHRGYRYWRSTRDGRVLVGGWRDTAVDAEAGYAVEPTDAVQAHLDAHLRELGCDAEVTHRWAGTMGFTPDLLPLCGRTELPGVYLCAGFSGHGMGFAVNAAERVVALATEGTPPPEWMSPARFTAGSAP